MEKKKGAGPPGEGVESTPPKQYKYANELQLMIDRLDPSDFVEGTGEDIIQWFKNLETFASDNVRAGLQFGKIMRNRLVKEHLELLLPIFGDLCAQIKSRDADIYDLKNFLASSDDALLKAKVWTLERENATLRAKLDLNEDVTSAIKDLLPKIDDLKLNNSQTLREELPTIIKQATCPDIRSSLEIVNKEIITEVKKNRDETRSFAQVAYKSKDLLQGAPLSLRPSTPTEPEGVLLIKPKSELLKDYDENRKTFLNILRENNPEIRLRSVGKIFGGGLKIVASTEEDVSFIRNVFTDHGDRDLLENFDLIIPNKRFPQLILYNVDKDVKLETLQTGLLAKNIFLANSMNKPHFKIEFSIPAKDRCTSFQHCF
ncbi:hypothetical protein AVEN_44603-1 [Araneus ventricosus]|uniref:Uncharacterized protein n=1 Tax=Araneus ventricosus TaxID=182803 RepID=A0A4Y2R1M8_ARAVE|nr:hypothetical protein AVEN_44603-1 [Araneus ventricosus]